MGARTGSWLRVNIWITVAFGSMIIASAIILSIIHGITMYKRKKLTNNARTQRNIQQTDAGQSEEDLKLLDSTD